MEDNMRSLKIKLLAAMLSLCLMIPFLASCDIDDIIDEILAPVGSEPLGDIQVGASDTADTEDQQQENDPANNTELLLPCPTPKSEVLSTASEDKKDISHDDEIKSAGVILVDLSENKSVAEKNADVKIYPASLTKIMTLLIACENAKDPSAMLTVTREMIKNQTVLDSSAIIGFSEGQSISVKDAMYLISYNSDSVACMLLAEHIAGSEEEFVKLMNEKAAALGLKSTQFKNCTGIFNKEHFSTCREIAAIMAHAMKNPMASKILSAHEKYTVDIFLNEKKQSSTTLHCNWYNNRLGNDLSVSEDSDIKIISGKTGYETIPTTCFATMAQNSKTNTQYICVVIGRTTDSQVKVGNTQSALDTRLIYQRYAG